MNGQDLWQSVLAQIQLIVSPANFSTWFKNTDISEKKDGVIVISVPNLFTKEWIEKKYHKEIVKILHSLGENVKEIKYVVGKKTFKTNQTVRIDQNYYQNRLEIFDPAIDKKTDLNSRYTFDNFVVGPFNELPHAAAVAVSKNPGFIYNPLFIYGGVGLGKTHLLQAIGNEIVKNIPDKKVKYISTEKFASGVISAIKNQKMEEFKFQYSKVDVLIIDDVQFLAGKEKTQEEFFHIFNSLYEKNKQIVLSSDKPPRVIPALTERLRSRFEGGMIADIGIPDFETRVAILKTKSTIMNINLEDDVLEYIAKNIQRNIRELEGALNRLFAYQKLHGYPPNLETTKHLLKNVLTSQNKPHSPDKIIKAVADFYEITEKELIAQSRKKEVVYPRQIAMYLLREELKCSFPFIGKKFKGKDHTTAIYAYEKISRELEKNKKIEEEIELIKQKIIES
jgi:chromosomal replication initiator protein